MNLLLDNAVTDITGKTGMTIIRAIVEGERDANQPATFGIHGAKRVSKRSPSP